MGLLFSFRVIRRIRMLEYQCQYSIRWTGHILALKLKTGPSNETMTTEARVERVFH